MLIHVDSYKYKVKPEHSEVGSIKKRFTKAASVKDMTVKQIAGALIKGKTIQPGVCPFSEQSRIKGNNGTVKEDFARQTIFLNDIDNKRKDVPVETPASIAKALKAHKLKAAFMYETFNSTADNQRLRYALVCDEEITDKNERDRIQAALIALSRQSDKSCTNADRIFFGTDKGLIDGFTDFEAVCSKADLLALADEMQIPENPEEAEKAEKETATGKNEWTKFGETIPTGQRHPTLVSFASTVLKKYGISEKAHELYMQRVAQCAEPKPDDEIKKIWRDACKFYEHKIATDPNYKTPDDYNTQEFADESGAGEAPKKGKKRISNIAFYVNLARAYMTEHKYLVGVQRLTKGGFGNDTIYEYHGGVWYPLSDTDVKSILAKRVLSVGVIPDPAHIDKAYKVILSAGRRKDVDTFNADENLVSFKNGVYRLSDGATLPHSPEHYFTFQLNANIPDEIQPTPYCDLCISNFGGADVQFLLYQLSGGAMSNVDMSKFKKAVLQVGKSDAGKTQLKRLNERIVGDGNYNNVDLSNLENNRFLAAAFQNVQIAGSNDMSNVRITEMKLFKQFTGGDSVQAENKGEKSFTFRFKGLLWFLANQLPLFGGDKSDAVYNRWIVIPCEHTIPPEKQIKDLQEKMFEERDSFCIKALQAFQKAVENNYTFDIPESCKLANDEYRRKNSVVRTFIDECCKPLDRDNAPKDMTTGQFWRLFKRWCADGNFYMPGKAEFKRELATIAGVDEAELIYHNKTGNYYPYIVTDEAKQEIDPYSYIPPLS